MFMALTKDSSVAATNHDTIAAAMRWKLDRQRAALGRDGAPDYWRRRQALGALLNGILARKEDFVRAASEDFGGRAREETLILELTPLVDLLRHARRHLKHWMRARSVRTSWRFWPARSRVIYQPLGVAGIISPWNYPIYLSLAPLVDAIAAGNHALVKPSEVTPQTSELLRSFVASIFSDEYVSVVTGGPEVSAAFAALPFDHLLFTGSTRVGRLVMRAASEHLTPVTLELGGKSPAIIHRDYPLRLATERLLVGKLYNAGQTCIAPDYILLHADQRDAFVHLAQEIVPRLYPRLVKNADYTRIISRRHYERLAGLIEDARRGGARIIDVNPAEERCDGENCVFPPTLILDAPSDAAIMQEEIFGPILPILSYRTLDEAINYVNERPRPLALYYFDDDSTRINKVLTRTVSGGVTINDVVFHIAQHNLPFGGVGPSGMGHYHGFAGFETFSKKKGVFHQSRFSALAWLRPPYGPRARQLIRFLIGK